MTDIEDALVPVAREAEKIARRMAMESGLGEGTWETFLVDAYDELLPADIAEDDNTDD